MEEGPAEWEELWAPVEAAVGVVAEVGAGQPFGLSTQASPAPGVSEGPAGCLRPRTDSAGGMNEAKARMFSLSGQTAPLQRCPTPARHSQLQSHQGERRSGPWRPLAAAAPGPRALCSAEPVPPGCRDSPSTPPTPSLGADLPPRRLSCPLVPVCELRQAERCPGCMRGQGPAVPGVARGPLLERPAPSRPTPCASRLASHARPAPRAPSPRASRLPPHPLRHFSSLLLADSSFPRMTDDYPSFGDSSLFGANVYYRGTVALGRTGLIPAAHVYKGGLRTAEHALACRTTR